MPDQKAFEAAGISSDMFPLIYGELRQLARRRMRSERRAHTLRPTELVHEVFMRLSLSGSIVVQSRAHFLGLAGRTMRQILVDHARRRNAAKRGGGVFLLPLEEGMATSDGQSASILELEDALNALAKIDQNAADIVVHRYFGGLTDLEIGQLMGRSDRWVRMRWTWARAWLRRELDPERG